MAFSGRRSKQKKTLPKDINEIQKEKEKEKRTFSSSRMCFIFFFTSAIPQPVCQQHSETKLVNFATVFPRTP